MVKISNTIHYDSVTFVHPAQQFVSEASKHLGPHGKSWVISKTSIPVSWGWCAATICAVVKVCGFTSAFPSSIYAAATFARQVVERFGGTYIPGPVNGAVPATLQPGDLFVCSHSARLKNAQNTYEIGTKYAGYHIGVVAYSKGNSFVTVEGNVDNQYVSREISLNIFQSQIGYFVRPDWTRLGATTNSYAGYASTDFAGIVQGAGGSLYKEASSRADATLRRVAYLNSLYEPSISMNTKVPLSLINYTSGLAALYYAVAPSGLTSSASGDYEVDVSALPQVPQVIVNYFLERGLNASQALGILVVIDYASGCKTDKSPATGKKTPGYGLCAWKTSLSNTLGTGWADDLSGQLDYLWNDLSGGAHKVLDRFSEDIKTNSAENAKKAAAIFYTMYVDSGSTLPSARKKFSSVIDEVYPKIKMSGDSHQVIQVQGRVVAHSGAVITKGTKVMVPNTVYQTGIIPSMTSYPRNWKYLQKTIYNMWVAEGRKSQYGIATLNGYYLIALGPAFATTGNIVTVVLENGKYFNAILADAKNTRDQFYLPADVPFTPYGHWYQTSKKPNLHGWAVDIVEFEAANENQAILEAGLKNAGWYGQKVSYIINYGPYIDDGKTETAINGWIYRDV